MKQTLVTLLLTLTSLGLIQLDHGKQSASAQEATRFTCENHQGIPITVAKTPTKDVPIIRWVSDHFAGAGYTPEKRCQEVSLRFQSYYDQGLIRFMTTGRMNSQSVVCVTSQEQGPCQGLLFTLKPESNPNKTLLELMAVRVSNSGALNETTGRVYIDFEGYLQEASQSVETEPLW